MALYFQEAGCVDPRAGEAEEELRSSVEPRQLHCGPDGRTAGGSGRLGQASRKKGAVEVTYYIVASELSCCKNKIHIFANVQCNNAEAMPPLRLRINAIMFYTHFLMDAVITTLYYQSAS